MFLQMCLLINGNELKIMNRKLLRARALNHNIHKRALSDKDLRFFWDFKTFSKVHLHTIWNGKSIQLQEAYTTEFYRKKVGPEEPPQCVQSSRPSMTELKTAHPPKILTIQLV